MEKENDTTNTDKRALSVDEGNRIALKFAVLAVRELRRYRAEANFPGDQQPKEGSSKSEAGEDDPEVQAVARGYLGLLRDKGLLSLDE